MTSLGLGWVNLSKSPYFTLVLVFIKPGPVAREENCSLEKRFTILSQTLVIFSSKSLNYVLQVVSAM